MYLDALTSLRFHDECRVDIRATLRKIEVAAVDGAIHSTSAHNWSASFPREVHKMRTTSRHNIFLVTNIALNGPREYFHKVFTQHSRDLLPTVA